MIETRSLPYFGLPTKHQVEMLIAGKALLGVDFFVHTEPAGDNTDTPALAFQHPDYPYLPGYAYVANSDTPEKFRNALACVFGIRYTEFLTTPAQWLSRATGTNVVEVLEG